MKKSGEIMRVQAEKRKKRMTHDIWAGNINMVNHSRLLSLRRSPTQSKFNALQLRSSLSGCVF